MTNENPKPTEEAERAAPSSAAELIYPLAHGTEETRRLIQQSAFINPFTRALFVDAGISPGMTVLDVGSGAGDVALIAAGLVGSCRSRGGDRSQ